MTLVFILYIFISYVTYNIFKTMCILGNFPMKNSFDRDDEVMSVVAAILWPMTMIIALLVLLFKIIVWINSFFEIYRKQVEEKIIKFVESRKIDQDKDSV